MTSRVCVDIVSCVCISLQSSDECETFYDLNATPSSVASAEQALSTAVLYHSIVKDTNIKRHRWERKYVDYEQRDSS